MAMTLPFPVFQLSYAVLRQLNLSKRNVPFDSSECACEYRREYVCECECECDWAPLAGISSFVRDCYDVESDVSSRMCQLIGYI